MYQLPYDKEYPVVCMDESCKQLIGEVRAQIPVAPGRPMRYDDEYVRYGVAEIFLFVEPLNGRRYIHVTEHRTRKDWALQIRDLLNVRYPRHTRSDLSWTTSTLIQPPRCMKLFPLMRHGGWRSVSIFIILQNTAVGLTWPK